MMEKGSKKKKALSLKNSQININSLYTHISILSRENQQCQ